MGEHIQTGAGEAGHNPYATSGAITKYDRVRARELFRYYKPDEFNEGSPAPTPALPDRNPSSVRMDSKPSIKAGDKQLSALAQLIALRLRACRTMINVIGIREQYTLIDMTKTMDLDDHTNSEAEGDGPWVGCGSSMDKTGSICEVREDSRVRNKY